ncbi:hypothetical protein [Capillimicrobium parvum]|uniref:Lipoprotein n=1 Tax=Capillimicrobium parvum TaxID=2884022 RepID=A0A9E7C0P6_9ACTN|nr:hypothetical protein [Capillimicrobium parvum]UGS36601.1 hypothetical protein DSM104329_03009 [Capillimicrobium parvum]
MRSLLGAVLVAALVAGCGGSSGAGSRSGSGGPTLQEAKAKLRLACLQGSRGRLDRRLCRCIVREASRRGEYDTPEKLEALSRRTGATDAGGEPAPMRAVARLCADQVAGSG